MSYIKALTLEESFHFARNHGLRQTRSEGSQRVFYDFEDGYFMTQVDHRTIVLGRAANENWKFYPSQVKPEFADGGDWTDEYLSGFDGDVSVYLADNAATAFFCFYGEHIAIELTELEDEI